MYCTAYAHESEERVFLFQSAVVACARSAQAPTCTSLPCELGCQNHSLLSLFLPRVPRVDGSFLGKESGFSSTKPFQFLAPNQLAFVCSCSLSVDRGRRSTIVSNRCIVVKKSQGPVLCTWISHRVCKSAVNISSILGIILSSLPPCRRRDTTYSAPNLSHISLRYFANLQTQTLKCQTTLVPPWKPGGGANSSSCHKTTGNKNSTWVERE